MSRLPLRHGWRTHIAAPLFHTWGFAHLALACCSARRSCCAAGSTPRARSPTIQDERCESLVVIPVMLQRILALPEETLAAYDLSRVEGGRGVRARRCPATSALSWMDHFGDHLYNIYGSTEVAYASIATPEDLREAPSSAGRPPHATVVRILDEDGRPVPDGETGRIFVGNSMLFEGYTGGGSKDMVDGPDVDRRRRQVRRRRPALRRGPRRRDDRLRRRERLPAGGRGLPRRPRRRSPRPPRSASTTTTTASGCGPSWWSATSSRSPRTTCREHVKANLARYKVPRDIVFLDELPRNATGKVLKRDLAERADDGAGTADG